jgi:hypothetical protein
MLGSARHELEAIRSASGLTDHQFRALCLPALRHYAAAVQSLPLSRSDFSERDGAWRFGLEAAMVSCQYAGTVIFFPEKGSEARRVIEPQCRFMAFFAALASGLAIVFSQVAVWHGEDEYSPLIAGMPLHEWLSARPGAILAWRAPNQGLAQQIAGAIAVSCLPVGVLRNFDLACVHMMYGAITAREPAPGCEDPLAKVVRESVEKVRLHRRGLDADRYHAPGMCADQHGADARAGATAVQFAAAEVPPRTAPAPGHASGGLDPALREWLTALKSHAQYPALRTNLRTTDEGIEVPISMLGLFGISGISVRTMLADAGLVLRRTASARELVLAPSLMRYFPGIGQEGG